MSSDDDWSDEESYQLRDENGVIINSHQTPYPEVIDRSELWQRPPQSQFSSYKDEVKQSPRYDSDLQRYAFCCAGCPCRLSNSQASEAIPSPIYEKVESEYHKYYAQYEKKKLEVNGRLRIKHVIEVLDILGVEYDMQRYLQNFWANCELYIQSFAEFMNVARAIQVDNACINAEAKLKEEYTGHIYDLPTWLLFEFSPMELAYYHHNFSLVCGDKRTDVATDSPGLDASRFKRIAELLGYELSTNAAVHIVQDFLRFPGGGLNPSSARSNRCSKVEKRHAGLNFHQFMLFVFRARERHGGTSAVAAVDKNIKNKSFDNMSISREVHAALMKCADCDIRDQLDHFKELYMLKKDPPPFVRLISFGGNPFICDFLIDGPTGTCYEGGTFPLKVIIEDGYPDRRPLVYFETRVLCVTLLINANGTTSLPHLDAFWNNQRNRPSLPLSVDARSRRGCVEEEESRGQYHEQQKQDGTRLYTPSSSSTLRELLLHITTEVLVDSPSLSLLPPKVSRAARLALEVRTLPQGTASAPDDRGFLNEALEQLSSIEAMHATSVVATYLFDPPLYLANVRECVRRFSPSHS